MAFNIPGDWKFGTVSAAAIAQLTTANMVFVDIVTGLFTYDTFTVFSPSADYNFSGNDQFTGSLDINTPNALNMRTSGVGNNILINSIDAGLTLQATTPGQQIQIYSDSFNFVSELQVNLTSSNGNIGINANNGGVGIGGANFLNIFTTSGGMNINTNTGDLSINAGNGPSTGNLNLGSSLGTININAPSNTIGINANNDININSTLGGISLNANGSNISAQTTGISMGVSAGSGLNIDSVTGDFQFGAQTGSFLLGALANFVHIIAGTTFTLDSVDAQINGTASVTLTTPSLKAVGIGTEASVLSPPLNSPPVGFSYLIMDDATGEVRRMT